MAKFQQLEKQIKSLDDEIVKLTNDMKSLIDMVNKQSKSQNDLAEKTEKVKKASEQISDVEKERLKLVKKLNEANSDQIQTNEELKVQLAKQRKTNKDLAKDKLKLIGAYEKESKRLVELRKRYKDLVIEGKGAEESTKALGKEVAELDEKLKDVDKSAGQSQRNVGNYTDAIDGATQGLLGATKAAIKFIATPIGAVITAIVGVVTLMVKAFKRSEDRTTKLRAIMGRLAGVFNLLLKALEPVVDFILDHVIATFDALGKAVDKTLGFVSKALGKLGFDKAAEKVDNFSKKLDESAKAGERLVKAEAELIKMQRVAEKTQLDFQKQAEKLRQIRDDEALAISERIKANEELGRVLQKQLQDELVIANKALEVSRMRIDLEGETTVNLDERAEALTRISDIQERISGQESEQLVNINSLLRERAQLEKEFREGILQDNEAAYAEYAESVVDLDDWIQEEIDESLAHEEEMLKQTLDKQEKLRVEAAKKEIENTKLTEEQKKQIKEAAIVATGQIVSDRLTMRIDEELAKTQDAIAIEQALLKKQLENGEITEKEFTEKSEKLQKESRIEQAKADKKKAIYDIAIATAVGVAKAIPVVPLMILAAALGAAQLAVVASKPIPKFKTGTKGKLNEGTFAIVGDGGEQELINTPYGSYLSDNKPQQVWLPRNSEVFSGADTKEMLQGNEGNVVGMGEVVKAVKANTAAVKNSNGSITWTDSSLTAREKKKGQINNHIAIYIRG